MVADWDTTNFNIVYALRTLFSEEEIRYATSIQLILVAAVIFLIYTEIQVYKNKKKNKYTTMELFYVNKLLDM